MADTVGGLLFAFQSWLASEFAPATVRLDVAEPVPNEGISIFVTRVERGTEDRRAGEYLAVDVSVLLVVDHREPAEAANLAGEVVFALSEGQWIDESGKRHRVELVAGTEVDAALAALGRPRALATLVRLSLVRERERRAVRPVLKPLELEIGEIGQMEGTVVGEIPGSEPRPLPEARVTAPDFRRTTVSDNDGRFRLAGLPPEGPVSLVVSAKGLTHSVSVSKRSGVRLVVPMNNLN
ncbi:MULTISPECIES: carboxypeptidase-like regulatory domain-containing protein [unclassified Ensifer]|uniref:carboxypeptidase-like regulatory domain-containing protein n=1 Tax=unclassified Ensifer TaxID=2633371 RepID=UPI00300FD3AF